MLSSLVMELMEYSKNTITVSHRYEAVIFILLLFCVDHKHYAKLTIIEARTSNFECANLESGCKIKGRYGQMMSDLPNNLRFSIFFSYYLYRAVMLLTIFAISSRMWIGSTISSFSLCQSNCWYRL